MTDRLGGAVVVGVDGSDHALGAARWAAAHAARHGAGLRLVRACRLPSAEPERTRAVAGARRELWTAARAARAVAPGVAVEQVDVEGDPVDVLVAESATARTLVVGPPGAGGVIALHPGSTGDALARRAGCPLAVVRGPVAPDDVLRLADRVRPIVVGVDGSPASEAALAFAFAEADAWSAPLVAVHAWTDAVEDPGLPGHPGRAAYEEQEREVLGERLAGWGEKYPGVRVSPELVPVGAARALVARSATARAVVVGSFGRGTVGRMLFGSTGRALLHHAAGPVVVVRPGQAAGEPAR